MLTAQLVIIWGSAIYHLVMGAFCLLSHRQLRAVTRLFYALQIPDEVDPKLEYGMRPLGAFALTLAAFCCRGALVHDTAYRNFLAATLAALFLLRALFRTLHRDLFFRAFGVPFERSLANIAFNGVLAAVLVASILYSYNQ